MKKKTIVLIGTLDTKREEIYFIEKLIKKKGFMVPLVQFAWKLLLKKVP